jgi:hypothetical protein
MYRKEIQEIWIQDMKYGGKERGAVLSSSKAVRDRTDEDFIEE